MARSSSDLRALSGMRAYAALLVVFVHLGGPSLAGAPDVLRRFVEGCAFPRLAPPVLFWPYLVLLVAVSLLAQRFLEEPARRWISRTLGAKRAEAVGANSSA